MAFWASPIWFSPDPQFCYPMRKKLQLVLFGLIGILVFSSCSSTRQMMNRYRSGMEIPEEAEPYPKLTYASKFIYENMEKDSTCRKSAFISSRFELIKDSFLKNKKYIETNPNITFFADAINELFPKCKFIHLIRHPGDFVRSGIRRKYYQNHDYDDGRIIPSNIKTSNWESYTQIKKIGWLWNETNQLIENWKKSFHPEKIITVKSEELFKDLSEFEKICQFCMIKTSNRTKLTKQYNLPVNVQKKGSFPPFDQWSISQKEELYDKVPLGIVYGYLNDD